MSSWTTHRAKIASLSRSRPADDPEIVAARQDLKAARLEDQIRATVDSVPSLRPEQIDHLAGLIRSGGAK